MGILFAPLVGCFSAAAPPPPNSPPIPCHSESTLGLPLCRQKETPLLAFMLLVEQQEDLACRAAPGAVPAMIGHRQERALPLLS